MKMGEYLALRDVRADGESGANNYFQTYTGMFPIPNAHAPSLRNPQKVKIPMAQDGWHKNSSAEARLKAIADMKNILERTARQDDIPTISRSAQYSVFPNMRQWE